MADYPHELSRAEKIRLVLFLLLIGWLTDWILPKGKKRG